MTSTTTALPACLTPELCDTCGCTKEDCESLNPEQQFTPHVCDLNCSARWWAEIAGCEVRVHDGVPGSMAPNGLIACVSDDLEHMRRRHIVYRTLADILGDPSSDASWLAARNVLKDSPTPFRTLEHAVQQTNDIEDLPASIARVHWSAALQEAE